MSIPPLAALWLSVLINSLFPIFGYLAAERIAPVLYVFAGSAIGFLCFVPWIARNRVFPMYFRPGLWPRLFAVGFFGTALPIALLVTALKYTTPANAAILCQIEVVYALLLSRIFLKEKISASQAAGTFLVLAGTLLIALKERFTVRWTGDLIVLAVPLFYQVSHLFSKKLPKGLSPAFVGSARALFAALGILPLLLPAMSGQAELFTPSLGLLGIVLAFGVVLIAVNNVLWYRALFSMDLSKATAIVLSYPVFTSVISHSLGMESLHAYQLAGLVMALAGAYWVTLLVKKDSVLVP